MEEVGKVLGELDKKEVVECLAELALKTASKSKKVTREAKDFGLVIEYVRHAIESGGVISPREFLLMCMEKSSREPSPHVNATVLFLLEEFLRVPNLIASDSASLLNLQEWSLLISKVFLWLCLQIHQLLSCSTVSLNSHQNNLMLKYFNFGCKILQSTSTNILLLAIFKFSSKSQFKILQNAVDEIQDLIAQTAFYRDLLIQEFFKQWKCFLEFVYISRVSVQTIGYPYPFCEPEFDNLMSLTLILESELNNMHGTPVDALYQQIDTFRRISSISHFQLYTYLILISLQFCLSSHNNSEKSTEWFLHFSWLLVKLPLLLKAFQDSRLSLLSQDPISSDSVSKKFSFNDIELALAHLCKFPFLLLRSEIDGNCSLLTYLIDAFYRQSLVRMESIKSALLLPQSHITLSYIGGFEVHPGVELGFAYSSQTEMEQFIQHFFQSVASTNTNDTINVTVKQFTHFLENIMFKQPNFYRLQSKACGQFFPLVTDIEFWRILDRNNCRREEYFECFWWVLNCLGVEQWLVVLNMHGILDKIFTNLGKFCKVFLDRAFSEISTASTTQNSVDPVEKRCFMAFSLAIDIIVYIQHFFPSLKSPMMDDPQIRILFYQFSTSFFFSKGRSHEITNTQAKFSSDFLGNLQSYSSLSNLVYLSIRHFNYLDILFSLSYGILPKILNQSVDLVQAKYIFNALIAAFRDIPSCLLVLVNSVCLKISQIFQNASMLHYNLGSQMTFLLSLLELSFEQLQHSESITRLLIKDLARDNISRVCSMAPNYSYFRKASFLHSRNKILILTQDKDRVRVLCSQLSAVLDSPYTNGYVTTSCKNFKEIFRGQSLAPLQLCLVDMGAESFLLLLALWLLEISNCNIPVNSLPQTPSNNQEDSANSIRRLDEMNEKIQKIRAMSPQLQRVRTRVGRYGETLASLILCLGGPLLVDIFFKNTLNQVIHFLQFASDERPGKALAALASTLLMRLGSFSMDSVEKESMIPKICSNAWQIILKELKLARASDSEMPNQVTTPQRVVFSLYVLSLSWAFPCRSVLYRMMESYKSSLIEILSKDNKLRKFVSILLDLSQQKECLMALELLTEK